MHIVGFVGDYVDNGASFSSYLPAVCYNGRICVPSTKKWTDVRDLNPISDADMRFVHPLSHNNEGRQLVAKSGDLVFLAGLEFVNRVSRLAGFEEQKFEFRNLWSHFGSRHKYKIGNFDEFADCSSSIFNVARTGLYSSLFAALIPLNGETNDFFQIVRRITEVDGRDWYTVRGVYYFYLRQNRKYELLAKRAVRYNYWSSEQEFKDNVRREVEWLSEKRPSMYTNSDAPEVRVSQLSREDVRQVVEETIKQLGGYSVGGAALYSSRIGLLTKLSGRNPVIWSPKSAVGLGAGFDVLSEGVS